MRRFITPRTEGQAARILVEHASALDPELAHLYDAIAMQDAGAIVVMPERITNPPQLSLYERANVFLGKLMMGSIGLPRKEAKESYRLSPGPDFLFVEYPPGVVPPLTHEDE